MKTTSKRWLGFLLMLVLTISGCGNAVPESDNKQASATAEASAATEYSATTRVYLAGPFFNDEEVENVELAESVLEDNGFEYFSPMRHSVDLEPGTTEWADAIFEMDKEQIDKADIVVAVYYGSESDSGTAWECGYASAIGKPIVLVHTRRENNSNLMMHCSATTNIYLDELADYDFESMPVHEYEGEML